MNATEWFDSIPSFEDITDTAHGMEMTEDAKEAWRRNEHTQWCWRHWAPCPVLGYNGIGMFVEMQHVYINEVKPRNLVTPAAINRHMYSIGRLCCTLGDERMYELWEHWKKES